ncbi:MAG: tetratricopeptide repeat protein [Pseudomonadota bacterium]
MAKQVPGSHAQEVFGSAPPDITSNQLLGALQGEVNSAASPLLQFIIDNVRYITGGIAVLIVAILISAGWRWYDTNVTETAQHELGIILVSKAGADRLAALESFVTTAPSSVQDGVYLEIATNALALGDYAKASAAYAKIVNVDGMQVVATVAQSSALLADGKAAEAVSLLDALENTAPETDRSFVRTHLVLAAEAAGDLQKALTTCERMLVAAATPSGADLWDASFLRFKIDSLKAQMKA